MASRQTIGLTDKLYWRPDSPAGTYHCYRRRSPGGGYESLCGQRFRLASGGQSCSRPLPRRRCAVCDAREMERRGWDASGPPY